MAAELMRRGDLADGLEHFRHALEVDPKMTQAHVNLATAYITSGKLAEALKQYEIIVELEPDSPEAQHNLAGLLRTQGRIEEAIDHFEKAPAASARLRCRPAGVGGGSQRRAARCTMRPSRSCLPSRTVVLRNGSRYRDLPISGLRKEEG